MASCVIGIDVGGTNTDAVVLQNDTVLAWHKTPTTADIQAGVEQAIQEVLKNPNVSSSQVTSVKIGTTQFVNAVLEEDSTKLDKVAVIRLCGPYGTGCPPFVDYPSSLRGLIEGHYGYVDGGFQVDGPPIRELNIEQLKQQAIKIKAKKIKSVVVVGIYSPSDPSQEEKARSVLSTELGAEYDVSCSHTIGRLGFLERENASILNASLRRFARHVIDGFEDVVHKIGSGRLYITLNDGTLSTASMAAEHPVLCFRSGPTNSARGAALLAVKEQGKLKIDQDLLVIDVGGTTTDICTLLENGFPRQSAACVRIAGVRTNFTIPDVHSIALGGGSIIRSRPDGSVTVGPDSIGCNLEKDSIYFGGETLTTTDLVLSNEKTKAVITPSVESSVKAEVQRKIEEAIDLVKTKKGDANVILVGGGSFIVDNSIAGVGQVIRPEYLNVANAIGAAIGKVCGVVDVVSIPTAEKPIEKHEAEAKALAIERCIAAGANKATIELIEVEKIPIAYVTNSGTRIIVRAVGDLIEDFAAPSTTSAKSSTRQSYIPKEMSDLEQVKASSYEITEQIDTETYRPKLEGNLWYLSELDLDFLQDGTGILGVGSCGEPYPTFLACRLALRNGEDITIMRQDTLPDDALILACGLIGSPTVYNERLPGEHEIVDAMQAVLDVTGHKTFTAVVPNEIGGLNAFEALLAAYRFKKSALDTDLVARAYPKVWQTVRCLEDALVTPSAVSDGCGRTEVFENTKDNLETEVLMRDASCRQGSLAGMCVAPMDGVVGRALPPNSFSWAWSIGRSIALARARKEDPIQTVVVEQNGALLFEGKITGVDRTVAEGFTRGSVTLDPISAERQGESLFVEFENENLSAVLKKDGQEKYLAICPDLISFLDMANGAPLGISDYKYGLRVSVVALRSPPVWTTEKGLEFGGPKAFGLDMDYTAVGNDSWAYEAPKSVWELFAS